MDALVKAAKKEGTLNVIALPPDWANYANIIKAFSDKYGIKVNSAQPDAASQDEINAAKSLKGTDRAPGRVRPRPVGGAREHLDVRAVQGGDLGRHPRRLQGRQRHLGQRLRRLHVDRLRLQQGARRSPASTTCSGPAFKGKVALNGDPTAGRRRVQRRDDGLARPTAARPTTSRPAWTTSAKLKKAGNFLPVDPTSATIESGQTPVVIDWDYLNAAESKKLTDLEGRRPGQRGRSPATTTRPSTRTPRTRPRPGSGRSSSTPTRARTSGSPAAPARCAPTRWSRPARIDKAAYDALPPVNGKAVTPTVAQTEKATTYLSANWAKAVG